MDTAHDSGSGGLPTRLCSETSVKKKLARLRIQYRTRFLANINIVWLQPVKIHATSSVLKIRKLESVCLRILLGCKHALAEDEEKWRQTDAATHDLNLSIWSTDDHFAMWCSTVREFVCSFAILQSNFWKSEIPDARCLAAYKPKTQGLP